MADQLDIFAVGPRGSLRPRLPVDSPRLARVDEPTSRAAVRGEDAAEQIGRGRLEALRLLQAATGPVTAAELAGDDYRLLIRLRKRLPDLAHHGLAESPGERVCRVAGTPAKTWRCTAAGRDAMP